MHIDGNALAELCRRHRITELSLFGSVLRDDFGPDSDIDIMVEFSASAHPTLFDLVTLRDEIRELLGRDVDLITKSGVQSSPNRLVREEILSSARVLYAA